MDLEFTDDDIRKLLKKCDEANDEIANDVKRLLARLEAAEKLVGWVSPDDYTDTQDYELVLKDQEAWLRSCGRGEGGR